MTKKLIPFFILLSACQLVVSQQSGKLISGVVKNTSLSGLAYVHVINLNTKDGTITDDNGNFEILVSVGDSLLFSSIQYHKEVILINSKTRIHKKLYVYLLDKSNQLDEVFIKKKLEGVLGIDLHKKPIDRKAEALKKTMDFSKIDFKVVEPNDHIDDRVRPPVVPVDPVGNFGAKASIGIPFKHSERMWALRRKLEFKKRFPAAIKSALGVNFFFKQLKIPKDRLYHFLEYCNPLGIENLYKENKILEVIKILRTESKTYLILIENNK